MSSRKWRTRKPSPSDLLVALSTKNPEVVERAIYCGADVNGLYREATPLHFAICYKLEAIVKILLAHGADVNMKSGNSSLLQEPPLVSAARLNFFGILKSIIECPRLDVNQVDFFGRQALYFAVRHKNLEMAKLLLDHDAHINSISKHKLKLNRHTAKMIKFLIRRGFPLTSLAPISLKLDDDLDTLHLFVKASYMTNEEISVLNCSESYKAMRRSPCSLKNICVCSIRKQLLSLYPNVHLRHVTALPIPKDLQGELFLP